jgi:hypothetical protein
MERSEQCAEHHTDIGLENKKRGQRSLARCGSTRNTRPRKFVIPNEPATGDARLTAFHIGCHEWGGHAMRENDQNHIRQELIRLSKLARSLRLKELAHFIDVASEVAAEPPMAKARELREARHA